jgi:hypothetical protein
LVFALQSGASAVAVDVDLEDGGMVDEPVDGGQGHGGIWEDRPSFAERLVGGDEDGATLVTGADQLEQDRGLGLDLADVREVVEDQEIEAIDRAQLTRRPAGCPA